MGGIQQYSGLFHILGGALYVECKLLIPRLFKRIQSLLFLLELSEPFQISQAEIWTGPTT